jgi:hypothetical protein
MIQTNLSRHLTQEALDRLIADIEQRIAWKTPEQGAATSVLLATSPRLDGIGGRYFEDSNEAPPLEPPATRGVAAYALDPEAAARLWQVSVETLGS